MKGGEWAGVPLAIPVHIAPAVAVKLAVNHGATDLKVQSWRADSNRGPADYESPEPRKSPCAARAFSLLCLHNSGAQWWQNGALSVRRGHSDGHSLTAPVGAIPGGAVVR